MRRTILLVLLLCMIFAVGYLPQFIVEHTPTLEIVTPTQVYYQPSIQCTGNLWSETAFDMVAPKTYLVEQRLAEVGAVVKRGELIATLSVPETADYFLFESQTGDSGQELQQLQALAEQYGVEKDALSALVDAQTGAAQRKTRTQTSVELRAPVDGVVTRTLPSAGAMVKAGNVLCSVEKNSSYLALVYVPQKDVGAVAVGNRATVRGTQANANSYEGTVRKIYPSAQKMLMGTSYVTVVGVEIDLEEQPEDLKAGFAIQAILYTETAKQMVILPYQGVEQNEENQEYVWVMAGQTIEKRPVQTGAELVNGVEIVEGLDGTETIVVPDDAQAWESQPDRYLLKKE